nr:Maleylpyruvate isomerase, mycothiol-dependent (EC 5.2.1.4) [Kibdelosporangium sp. MJ126-NF4]
MRWMTEGHAYFLSCLAMVSDAEIGGPSLLPGWTGKHLLSHVGHNARALSRLATWARTGQPTPMYASAGARVEEIESGAAWPVPRLRAFVEEEQEHLTAALDRLTDTMWQTEVVTAQGRTVPATTIPWLRSREVWIHACDLPSEGDFTAFPPDFLDALIEDVLTRLATQGIERPLVDGPAADLARWLTGRGESPLLHTPTGEPLPALSPWL